MTEVSRIYWNTRLLAQGSVKREEQHDGKENSIPTIQLAQGNKTNKTEGPEQAPQGTSGKYSEAETALTNYIEKMRTDKYGLKDENLVQDLLTEAELELGKLYLAWGRNAEARAVFEKLLV